MSNIQYYPYRSYKFFFYFILAGCILLLTAMFFCLSTFDYTTLFPITVCFLGLFFSIYIRRQSFLHFHIDDTEIILFKRKNAPIYTQSWTNLQNAYYAQTIHGHLFVLLSSKSYNKREVLHQMNLCAFKPYPIIDGDVVLFFDSLQKCSPIINAIQQNAKTVSDYTRSGLKTWIT